MPTYKVHLPGRSDALLGSVPEQDLNKAVIAMVCQYFALLNHVARSIRHDASETEDVVQETFLRVIRHENKLAERRADEHGWYA
jgi:DNA-directed RNA polymerase specialized sigma24 family protein